MSSPSHPDKTWGTSSFPLKGTGAFHRR